MTEQSADTGTDQADESASDDLKKTDLINMVVAQSGMKKKDVKPVVEATLLVLGKVLSEGRPMNLPPFGKAKVTRAKDAGNATVTTMRIRQSMQTQEAFQGLETSAEES